MKNDTDILGLELPNYTILNKGFDVSRHGGLLCYIHNDYSFVSIDVNLTSDIWEGQFLEVSHNKTGQKCIIANIYKPPKMNNNNNNIETFMSELERIVDNLNRRGSDVVLQVILILTC